MTESQVPYCEAFHGAKEASWSPEPPVSGTPNGPEADGDIPVSGHSISYGVDVDA